MRWCTAACGSSRSRRNACSIPTCVQCSRKWKSWRTLCCRKVIPASAPRTSKPIRFILPFPPGGGTDTLARIVSQKLGENLGQTMVLDNRPGAGANIGAEIGAHAVADGYTLTMGNVAHAINMTLYAKAGYDL